MIPYHLLERASDVPFEGLKSFLERTRIVNDYPGIEWYSELIGKKDRTDINQLTEYGVYENLAILTMKEIPDMISKTYNRFCYFFYSKEFLEKYILTRTPKVTIYSYQTGFTSKYLLCDRNRKKICPKCLAENQAFLLPWQLRLITTCPVHNIELIDHCPKCHQFIKLSKNCCNYCGLPIEQMDGISLSRIGEELSNITWAAVGCNWSTENRSLIDKSHPIFSLSSHEFINAFLTIALLVFDISDEESNYLSINRRALPFLQINKLHIIYSKVIALLANWPNGWQELCLEIFEKENLRLKNGLALWHSLPHRLNHAFPGKEWDWIKEPIATLIYKSSTNNFMRWRRHFNYLIEQKYFNTEPINSFDKQIIIAKLSRDSDTSQKRTLGTVEKKYLSEAGAAKYLGVGRKYLTKLIEGKFVLPCNNFEPSKKTKNGSKNLFLAEDLDIFLNEVVNCLPIYEVKADDKNIPVPLFKAILNYRPSGISFVSFLDLIICSKIPAYKISEKGNFLSIVIKNNDLIYFRNEIQKKKDELGFSTSRVSKILRCRISTLRDIALNGELLPFDCSINFSYWRYSKDTISNYRLGEKQKKVIQKFENASKRISNELITTTEVANIFGTSTDAIRAVIRRDKFFSKDLFRSVNGSNRYMFDREGIICLRESFLYLKEVLALLNIKRRTLSNWVREGRLTPLKNNPFRAQIFSTIEVQRIYEDQKIINEPQIIIRKFLNELKNSTIGDQKTLEPLSDMQWVSIKEYFPSIQNPLYHTTQPTTQDRNVVDAILWSIYEKKPLSNIPKGFPSKKTCFRRIHNWRDEGALDSIKNGLLKVIQ